MRGRRGICAGLDDLQNKLTPPPLIPVHDQGHIAAKLTAPNRTAGLTIGTPILFSSVAHGSALDIAGQNKAQAGAIVEAVARLVGVGKPSVI